MKTQPFALAALAAAVALAGCDSSTGELSDNPIQITPENAPVIAAEGMALTEGAMDIADVGEPPIVSIEMDGLDARGAVGQGMTLSKVAALLRAHLVAAGAGGGSVLDLPIATELPSEPIPCETSGTRLVTVSGGNWDMLYDACVERYEYSETDFNEYRLDGHASGTYTEAAYGGSWEADYDDFRSSFTASYGGVQVRDYSYLMDGHFESDWTYDPMDYSSEYHYGATGLYVEYSYDNAAYYDYEATSGSGRIDYENYQFSYTNDGNEHAWSGFLLARDSRRGQWYINTLSPFTTNYCEQTVSGEILYAGGYYEHEHEGAGGGEGNTLRVLGNGDNSVTYSVFTSTGALLSSRTETWWSGEDDCRK